MQEEDEEKLTPSSSSNFEANKSSLDKEKVLAVDKASIKSGGLAALDSMPKKGGFHWHFAWFRPGQKKSAG